MINSLKKNFENSEMVFDAVSDMGLMYVNRYVKKTGNLEAQMYFSVNHGQEFAELSSTRLIEECGFYQNMTKQFKKKLKLYTRIS
ncbi:MAG: hypothetical protein R3Y40_09740 [Eubacteriales bacterium]